MIGSKDGYALVTGASSGIGYELAKLFAEDGKNVVVLARSQNKLEDLKKEIEDKYGTMVIILVKDLSDPNSPQEIFAQLEQEGKKVDVLVNNAGFTVWGKFSDNDWQKESEMIQVNITALTHLTKLYLPKMLGNRSGKILNVASLVGFAPSPFCAMYAASKAYVLHYSEALANELQGTGVSVTCLCPGPTETLFYERANIHNCRGVKMKMMDAATAAKVGYKALEKGKVISIPGFQNRLMPLVFRILPRGITTWMGGKILEPI
jgi:short-subunit dehydrogenase